MFCYQANKKNIYSKKYIEVIYFYHSNKKIEVNKNKSKG